jgi:hypothetical protein
MASINQEVAALLEVGSYACRRLVRKNSVILAAVLRYR